MSNDLTIEKFKHILYSCYDKDTGYKSTENLWDKTNRSVGQCTVTALLIRDYFGGYIKRGYIKARRECGMVYRKGKCAMGIYPA